MLAKCFVPMVLIAALATSAAANLVTNGDFANAADGKPAGWSVVESPQKVTAEKVDDKTVLKVEIVKENGKNLGEIRQTVKIKPKTKYRFSGDVKSSKGSGAMFMLKPRVNKKEGERINAGSSKAEWATLTKDFDSGDADEVQILCRFNQKADQVGVVHLFTNIKLNELDADGKVIEKAAAPAAKPQAGNTKAPAAAAAVATPKVADAGVDQFVTADGAGDKSGKDFANARDGAGLQAAIDAAGPRNTVWVGSGTYKAGSINFASGGGSEGKIKTLAGKDTGSGLPVFKGGWTRDNPEKSGGTFLTIPGGVNNVAVRDLKLNNVKTAISLKGPNKNIEIANVDVTESRDPIWIEGKAVAGDDNSYSRDITIKDCDLLHYTKKGVRIFGGVTKVQITNTHANAGGKEWALEVFPNGFAILGGDNGVIDSDITFTDCTATGNYWDAGDRYWNADGYSTERAVKNVTWIRCGAFDNTDGGWDLKSAGTKMIDCIGTGNKRNFRLWSNSGDDKPVLENCLSAFSIDRGNHGHDVGFWIMYGGESTLKRCTSWGDRLSLKIERKEAGEAKPTSLQLDHCVLAPKEGGKDRSLAEGTDVKDPGTVTTAQLTAPKEGWRGGDEAFNVKGNTEVGYHFKK